MAGFNCNCCDETHCDIISKLNLFLMCAAKEALLMDTEHGDALQKLRMLEDSSRYTKTTVEETIITQAPT